nr:hypothetical protein [Tanacetum cinerariifolium]
MNQQREQEALLTALREKELCEQEQASQEKKKPPQNSDLRQLIGEIDGTKVCEEQKQNMKDTMLELLEVCRQKELYYIMIGHYEILSDSNDDATSSDDNAFEDIKYVEASPPDYELVSLEESSSSFPIIVVDIDSFFEKLDTFLSYLDNSLPEFETFSDHTKETRSGSTTAHANNSLPEYDSFRFEIKPDQGRLTSVVMDNISNDSTNDPLLEAVNLFFASNNSIPPGIKNIDYYSEGDIHVLEELLSNDSIPLPKNELSNFEWCCFNIGMTFWALSNPFQPSGKERK